MAIATLADARCGRPVNESLLRLFGMNARDGRAQPVQELGIWQRDEQRVQNAGTA